MPDLAEEKYAALDKTKGMDFFAKRKAALAAQAARSIMVDAFTADYLIHKAIAVRKTPADIIGEMVEKEIADVL